MLHTLNVTRTIGDKRVTINIDSKEKMIVTTFEKERTTFYPVSVINTTYSEWLDLSLDVHRAVDTLRKEFGTNE